LFGSKLKRREERKKEITFDEIAVCTGGIRKRIKYNPCLTLIVQNFRKCSVNRDSITDSNEIAARII
jgi:hypothetical protein